MQLTNACQIREVADYVNEEKRIAEQMEELIRLKYTLEGFKGGVRSILLWYLVSRR